MVREALTSPDTPGALGLRTASEAEFPPGAHLGPYRVESLLAAGGCGAVYAARDERGERVALKVLHDHFAGSGEMVARMAREARIVGQIRHPGIVAVREIAELPDGRPYLAMELLEGVTLRKMLERRGRMSADEVLACFAPIADALAAAHRLGVVHRDLKASNVMVLREGPPPEVKLLDFGIAKLLELPQGERALTQRGQRLGTPHAMAPEQVRGEAVDARTDIYALGVLLYLLLTGRHPFEADDALELERMHLEVPPPRPSQHAPVDPSVEAVVMKCLEKSADGRFASVTALLEALRDAVPAAERERLQKPAAERSAVALLVEVRAAEADDDALFAALGDLLDAIEDELKGAGFSLQLQLSTAMLGVQLLPDAAAAEALRAAVRTAERVLALQSHPDADARLSLTAQLHRGPAQVRGSEISGPIAEFGAWALADGPALRLTPELQAALAEAG